MLPTVNEVSEQQIVEYCGTRRIAKQAKKVIFAEGHSATRPARSSKRCCATSGIRRRCRKRCTARAARTARAVDAGNEVARNVRTQPPSSSSGSGPSGAATGNPLPLSASELLVCGGARRSPLHQARPPAAIAIRSASSAVVAHGLNGQAQPGDCLRRTCRRVRPRRPRR